MSTLSTSKILICIYTCENDVDSLNELKETEWYKKYSQYNNITIIDVYADENINQEYNYKNNELTVKTEESYTNLSIKTYKMIETCINIFDFNFLIKLDSAIIQNKYNHINSKFSFEYFVKSFKSGKILKDYGGCCPILATSIDSLNHWSNSKGLESSPSLFLMSIGRELPQHYWAGSSYCLSRKNCLKVIKNEDVFSKAKDYMCGIEDLSIGICTST